jgi:hypothetical protein
MTAARTRTAPHEALWDPDAGRFRPCNGVRVA